MSSGMDSSILDAYLYEENNLLDQLDEMLVADEKNGDFSTDDVNEIFRIMHTIKGSSAMMEFNSISTIAHRIEDVFFYIRDKGIETLDPEHKKELFNLMFRSEDYLRSEIEKVEQGVPLSTDIDAFSNEINSFLKKISGAAPAACEASHLHRKLHRQHQQLLVLLLLLLFLMIRMQPAFSMFFWKKAWEWRICALI